MVNGVEVSFLMAWPQQEISLPGSGIVLELFDGQPVAVVPTTWSLPAASFTTTRRVADLAGSFPAPGPPRRVSSLCILLSMSNRA
jgi:hypothetical protein